MVNGELKGKRLAASLLAAVCSVAFGSVAFAAEYETSPYKGYNYDYWDRAISAPVAYAPAGRIGGNDMGIGAFNEPNDVFVRGDKIYIADTGNNRIVVCGASGDWAEVFEGYAYNGETVSFNKPNGVFVDEDGVIYAADTENGRIVAFGEESGVVRIIENPESETLSESFEFRPMKIAVDRSGRVYCVARNVFEGIMCFNYEGKFYGYYGTIRVSVNAVDWFWRSISTKAQKAQLTLFIPTEFSSLDIDDEGFIYTTNVDKYSAANSIKRLNPSGQDVLTNYTNKNIVGDPNGVGMDKSVLRDIKYRGHGMYSAVDANMGRVFTYDGEGDLLYVFGGLGYVEGTVKTPAAVESLSDDTMLVLDKGRSELLFYKPTEYGRLINEAVKTRYGGDESAAVGLWEKVLELDANNPLAFVGIGKSYLAAENNKLAMEYLRKGMDLEYYSVAFKRYRNDVLRGSLPFILTGAILLTAGVFAYKIVKKRRSAA